jgi:hypothetical protein
MPANSRVLCCEAAPAVDGTAVTGLRVPLRGPGVVVPDIGVFCE